MSGAKQSSHCGVGEEYQKAEEVVTIAMMRETQTMNEVDESQSATILFRSRISENEFERLIQSAKETHQDYRSGQLLSKHREQQQKQQQQIESETRSDEIDSGSGSASNTKNENSVNLRSSTTLPLKRPRAISRQLQRIVTESVTSNRLTLISGPAGSGKSTQIPRLLLQGMDGGAAATLCLLPNALTVRAISKQVAAELEMNSNRVAYHLGHRCLSTQTAAQLLFTTPPVLLQNLHEHGWKCLKRFRVLIMDEFHKRSTESDLILALTRQHFIDSPESSLRLVLMSASMPTPHNRYQQYFSNVKSTCGEINLGLFETLHRYPVQMFYLDDILPMIPSSRHASFGRQMRIDPDAELNNESLSPGLLSMVESTITWLHKSEPHSGSFLIFAPTRLHLEQLHSMLKDDFQVDILEATMDLEDSLRIIDYDITRHVNVKRRILLASSAFVDSSVTIPSVSCVIDLCRDANRDNNRISWSSKTACDQRSGRTGRTCPGKVFRLVYMGFYVTRFNEWDVPLLSTINCRDELLGLVCSSSTKVDAETLLDSCLDSPESSAVKEAIEYLLGIDAIEKDKTTNRIVPTQFGELLAAMPFAIADAMNVLAGAQIGLLHETLVMRAIYCSEVSPIVRGFGNAQESHSSQLRAYIYWDTEWNLKRRLECNKALWDLSSPSTENNDPGTNAVWAWNEQTEKDHIRWCEAQKINPTAVRSIAQVVEKTMNVFHQSKFEPEWLRCGSLTPAWRRRESWRGNDHHKDILFRVYGADVIALCAAMLALTDNRINEASKYVSQLRLQNEGEPLVCIHYLAGNCLLGHRCSFSHDIGAKRPRCKFFTAGACKRGKECWYEHEDSITKCMCGRKEGKEILDAKLPVLPLMHVAPREWFRKNCNNLLLIGDINFRFAKALTKLGMGPLLSSSTGKNHIQSDRNLAEVNVTMLHADPRIINHVQNNHLDRFAWIFPHIGNDDDDDDDDNATHEALLLEMLHSLALLRTRIAAPVKWIFTIALHKDQFSTWNLTQSAWKVGWRLQAWSTFNHLAFPNYYHQNFRSGHVSRIYVFELEGTGSL